MSEDRLMQDVVVALVAAHHWLITELDKVLHVRPLFCPVVEGDVLDPADSDISSSTDATSNVTGKSMDVITVRKVL